MTSANDNVNALHTAFCQATGRDLALNMTGERLWLEAHNEGLTPEDLRAVIKARQKAIDKGVRYTRCLALVNLVGSPEAILNVLDEAAEIKARNRVKVINPARAEVLRATGRQTDVPSEPAKQVGDVELMKKLKEAAQ